METPINRVAAFFPQSKKTQRPHTPCGHRQRHHHRGPMLEFAARLSHLRSSIDLGEATRQHQRDAMLPEMHDLRSHPLIDPFHPGGHRTAPRSFLVPSRPMGLKSKVEIIAGVRRLWGEEQIDMGILADELEITCQSLVRWVYRGKLLRDGRRVFLDGIKKDGNWRSSREAVIRYLEAVGQGRAAAMATEGVPA